MLDKFLIDLRKKQLEVASVPQQDLGRWNNLHKIATGYFKVYPWRILIPFAILLVLLFRLTTGFPLINLTSILQEGF